MNNATLISIVPFPIAEFKPGIYPGFFEISASRDEVPEVLVIGESVYHVELDESRTITVKCLADDIAKSIVDDYVVSNLAYSEEDDAAPGIMWVSGKLSRGEILSRFSEAIDNLKGRQRRWFMKLVQMADDDWEKTRQHKAISDMQRYAAKSLRLERPWIIAPSKDNEGMIKCPACQSFISSLAIVCAQCRCVINMEKWKTLQFADTK